MPPMSTPYERIRARLDQVRPGMSDREASLLATEGKNADLLRTMKQGRSSFPRGKNLEGLRALLDVPVEWLTNPEDYGDAPVELSRRSPDAAMPVVVAGKVAAGVFREVDDSDQSDRRRLLESPDERFPNARRMAFDVEGVQVEIIGLVRRISNEISF